MRVSSTRSQQFYIFCSCLFPFKPVPAKKYNLTFETQSCSHILGICEYWTVSFNTFQTIHTNYYAYIFRRSLTLICDEDGQWTGPVCVQNQCSPIPALFNGAYTCSDYLYRRSTCTMSCPGNLEVMYLNNAVIETLTVLHPYLECAPVKCIRLIILSYLPSKTYIAV